MDILGYFFILLICTVGSFLNLLCGFGIGVVCIIFLPYIMHSTTGPAALINMITVWQAIWLTWRYRRAITWKVILPALVGYFIASTAAVRVSVLVDFGVMERILGAFLLALSIYLTFFSDRLRLRPTVKTGVASGLVCGVFSGLFAVGGPPAALYFSATSTDKDNYLADLQGFFMISNSYAIAVRAANGIITREVLAASAVGLVGMAIGSFFANRIFRKVNEQFILRCIYAMTAVSGAVMLFF